MQMISNFALGVFKKIDISFMGIILRKCFGVEWTRQGS